MSTPAPVRRPRSRRGHGGALREELLAAADALLERTGDPGAVSLRAVAAEVGVAPTAVYLHFADRDELLVTVVELGFAEFARHVRAAAIGDTALERLVNQGVAYVGFARAHPGHYRLLFSRIGVSHERPDLERRCAAAGLAAFEACVEATQACIDEGVFHGDARVLAVGFWTMVHGYADLSIGLGPALLLPPDRTLRAFLDGVRCRV